MKLLILGSTGGTGRELVRQALRQGHTVTAFARNAADLCVHHARLSVTEGDILEPETLEAAARGQDAALSALGVAALGPSSTLSDGTQNVIEVLRWHSIDRFVCQSAMGVAESMKQLPALSLLFRTVMYPFVLRNVYADKELQEYYVRRSKLDWTLVRPAVLTDGPHTSTYRALRPPETDLQGTISRADVADFMLAALTDETTVGRAISLSY